MNKFNWLKAIGFGALVWAISAVLFLIALGLNIHTSEFTKISLAVLTAVIAYLFARTLNTSSESQAIGYGAVWFGVAVLLSLVVQLFNSSTQIFGIWEFWLGFALLFFTPWVQNQMQQDQHIVVR